MARIKICKEPDCRDAATTDGYCRMHYLKHWSSIKQASKRAAIRRLNRYIEHVCRENPDDYADVIRKDLRSPQFAGFAEEGSLGEDEGVIFGEGASEEEIERIIKKLKVEEGF
ncbi:MAG: hypothetical protein JXA24_01895 [Proteobacteria bacterium]|nr:hypothetical protein [Pseudomonadota bacterium]